VRYSEVVDAINAAVAGGKIMLPEGRNPDRRHNYLDTTRLREDTGFQRTVPDYANWSRTHDRSTLVKWSKR
jgi:UDP-glucose 4-epimerase